MIWFEEEFSSPRPLSQRLSLLVEGRAAEPIPFGRVVFSDSDGYRVARAGDGLFSGVNVSVDTAAGRDLEVLAAGPFETGDWTDLTGEQFLSPGSSYFLRDDGKYNKVPDDATIIRVGRAFSKRVLYVTFDLVVR